MLQSYKSYLFSPWPLHILGILPCSANRRRPTAKFFRTPSRPFRPFRRPRAAPAPFSTKTARVATILPPTLLRRTRMPLDPSSRSPHVSPAALGRPQEPPPSPSPSPPDGPPPAYAVCQDPPRGSSRRRLRRDGRWCQFRDDEQHPRVRVPAPFGRISWYTARSRPARRR